MPHRRCQAESFASPGIMLVLLAQQMSPSQFFRQGVRTEAVKQLLLCSVRAKRCTASEVYSAACGAGAGARSCRMQELSTPSERVPAHAGAVCFARFASVCGCTSWSVA